MKPAFIALLLSAPLLAVAGSSHAVHGYVAKSGTYVAPHQSTNPNGTKADNWSSKGNVNPYTGKEGTKDPYAASPPVAAPRSVERKQK